MKKDGLYNYLVFVPVISFLGFLELRMFIPGIKLGFNPLKGARAAGFAILCLTALWILDRYFVVRLDLNTCKAAVVFLIAMNLVLQLICLIDLRVNPSWDFGSIMKGADDISEGKVIKNLNYFQLYPYNLNSAVVIGTLKYIMLGSKVAPYALNVFAITVSIAGACLLSYKLYGPRASVLAALFCLGATPFYLYAPIVYTDTLSLPFAIWSIYAWVWACDRGEGTVLESKAGTVLEEREGTVVEKREGTVLEQKAGTVLEDVTVSGNTVMAMPTEMNIVLHPQSSQYGNVDAHLRPDDCQIAENPADTNLLDKKISYNQEKHNEKASRKNPVNKSGFLGLYIRLSSIIRLASIGCVSGLGYLIKPTAAVGLAAFFIDYIFNYNSYLLNNYPLPLFVPKKGFTKLRAVLIPPAAVLLSFIAVVSAFNLYIGFKSYNSHLTSESSFPSTHWLMMGMNKPAIEGGTSSGYGGFSGEDFRFTRSYKARQERLLANADVVRYRLKAFGFKGYLNFLLKKAEWTWTDGTYFAPVKLARYPVKINWLHKFVLFNKGMSNKLYLIYAQASQAVLLFLMLIGSFVAFRLKNKPYRLMAVMCILIALFLLFWETRSRYLVSMIPVFIVMAVYGMVCGFDFINKIIPKTGRKPS